MSEVKIPAYLVYPNDPIAEKMFGNSMRQIRNEKCGYQFMLYTEIANTKPEIEYQSPSYMINETHYYYRSDSLAWVTVR